MFWSYAVHYATVIANMLPMTTAHGWMSPFQAKYAAPADVHAFRSYGFIAYAHIAEVTLRCGPPPDGTLGCFNKWVVKKKDKPVPKLKARFTPRGFSQQAGVVYGETFAPVAKLVTLRIFLTIAAILSVSTCQLDLKTAFLNATLVEEIYCQPVHDHENVLQCLGNVVKEAGQRTRVAEQLRALRSGAVVRMRKACYGLKQEAPREWWKKPCVSQRTGLHVTPRRRSNGVIATIS